MTSCYVVDNYDGWLLEYDRAAGTYEFISPNGRVNTFPGDTFEGQVCYDLLDDMQLAAGLQDLWVQWDLRLAH